MITICYHNGALGNTLGALLSCCTEEGDSKFPSFLKGQHLHHFSHSGKLYKLEHPEVDIASEQAQGNTVVHSTSKCAFGKLLILTMGLHKWAKAVPDFNKPVIFNQGIGSYGEQIEILSATLDEKIALMDDDFKAADINFDIMWFWENQSAIEQFILNCGLTPIKSRIIDFANEVKATNDDYYHSVKKCFTVADDVMYNKNYKCDLTFFEIAIVHMLLAKRQQQSLYLLKETPQFVDDFKKLFKG